MLHPANRATARPPLIRQPSTQPSLPQQSMAETLAAATAAAAAPAATPAPAAVDSYPSLLAATAAAAANASTAATTATTPALTATPVAPADPPTPQSVFGANPWDTNPTGSGPTGAYNYNPYYFATAQTAATVASMVGGTVVQINDMGGPSGNPFVQSQPNEMVQLANGALINPGLVASFYTHGYSQSMVNQMISNEVANVSEGT